MITATTTVHTEEQFQIGDDVVYLPEGVITKISGYVWIERVGSAPTISHYRLDCGIAVIKEVLAIYIGDVRSLG